MKQMAIVGKNKMELQETAIPDIGSEEVLIRVRAVGICGTDVHLFTGMRAVPLPHVSGHECSGEIIDKGQLVPDELKQGNHVVIDPNIVCGKCWYCRHGKTNLCTKKKVIGVSLSGCFSDYVTVPYQNISVLPSGLPFWKASLIEPVAIAMHVVRMSDVKLNENVAVIGVGMIGLIIVQLLKKAGAYVTVIDIEKKRLLIAEALGSDRIIDTKELPFDQLKNRKSHYDIVIDAAGVPKTLEQSIKLCGSGGRVLWMGLPSTNVNIYPKDFIYRELKLISSLAYTYEFKDSLNVINNLILEPFVNINSGFDKIPNFLQEQDSGKSIKNVVLLEDL